MTITARLDPPPAGQTITVGHGLVYVHRDGQGVTLLDRGDYWRTQYPRIPRPERDVARALLRYALDQLDAMDEADGGKGTVRGEPAKPADAEAEPERDRVGFAYPAQAVTTELHWQPDHTDESSRGFRQVTA